MLRRCNLGTSVRRLLGGVLSMLLLMLKLTDIVTRFNFSVISLITNLNVTNLTINFTTRSALTGFVTNVAVLLRRSFRMNS